MKETKRGTKGERRICTYISRIVTRNIVKNTSLGGKANNISLGNGFDGSIYGALCPGSEEERGWRDSRTGLPISRPNIRSLALIVLHGRDC